MGADIVLVTASPKVVSLRSYTPRQDQKRRGRGNLRGNSGHDALHENRSLLVSTSTSRRFVNWETLPLSFVSHRDNAGYG